MMLDVDCDIIAGDWDESTDWDELTAAAVAAALRGAGFPALVAGEGDLVEVAIRLTDDAEIQRLNCNFRGRDNPTNVLSFPMHEPDDIADVLGHEGMDVLLGDIVIALETVEREAADKQISVPGHVTHLVVHGVLHLLGMDHQDDVTAGAMESLETRILERLGVADPYAIRCGDPAPTDVAPTDAAPTSATNER